MMLYVLITTALLLEALQKQGIETTVVERPPPSAFEQFLDELPDCLVVSPLSVSLAGEVVLPLTALCQPLPPTTPHQSGFSQLPVFKVHVSTLGRTV